jgi:leucyl aminopeptidase (aminopeptidase T)
MASLATVGMPSKRLTRRDILSNPMGVVSAPSPTLPAVARKVIHDYLAVQEGESFAVITDTAASPEISEALFAAAEEAGARAARVVIVPPARSGEEPPSHVAAAMAAADVCVCAASRSLYHTAAKGRAQEAGTRGVFNAPSRVESWTDGAMTADFVAVRKTAERLANILRGAREVRVTSPAGTDVVVSVEGREPKGWLTGVCRKAGEISALPGGEVSFPPLEGSANGTVVVEHVMTDLGELSHPISWTVRDGEAVGFSGGREAERLEQMIEGVPNARNIAELGIGLNPAARLDGEITEAKKRAGTAHMALGDNAGGYGGLVESPVHLDGLMLDVTVAVDGALVVDGGELVV